MQKSSTEEIEFFEPLILRFIEGDKQALEIIMHSIQPRIFNLAIRMLQVPEDAEDACQEILIKVVNNLSGFRGDSAFNTWVYRIATNHLLNMRRSRAEINQLSFDDLGERLEHSLQTSSPTLLEEDYEEQVLADEIKRGCTLGMLMCLNRELRVALILGEIFELGGDEAARILEITPEIYRKRLSRARKALVGFVSNHCGIINQELACKCHKHISNAIRVNKINPARLRYAQYVDEASLNHAALAMSQDLNTIQRVAALFKSHPQYPISDECMLQIKKAIGVSSELR
jgi:RNA polymerase sigma factor (sigma-70 family)